MIQLYKTRFIATLSIILFTITFSTTVAHFIDVGKEEEQYAKYNEMLNELNVELEADVDEYSQEQLSDIVSDYEHLKEIMAYLVSVESSARYFYYDINTKQHLTNAYDGVYTSDVINEIMLVLEYSDLIKRNKVDMDELIYYSPSQDFSHNFTISQFSDNEENASIEVLLNTLIQTSNEVAFSMLYHNLEDIDHEMFLNTVFQTPVTITNKGVSLTLEQLAILGNYILSDDGSYTHILLDKYNYNDRLYHYYIELSDMLSMSLDGNEHPYIFIVEKGYYDKSFDQLLFN